MFGRKDKYFMSQNPNKREKIISKNIQMFFRRKKNERAAPSTEQLILHLKNRYIWKNYNGNPSKLESPTRRQPSLTNRLNAPSSILNRYKSISFIWNRKINYTKMAFSYTKPTKLTISLPPPDAVPMWLGLSGIPHR